MKKPAIAVYVDEKWPRTTQHIEKNRMQWIGPIWPTLVDMRGVSFRIAHLIRLRIIENGWYIRVKRESHEETTRKA